MQEEQPGELGAQTTVVHQARRGGNSAMLFDEYIGPGKDEGGWRLPRSKWANPYRLSDFGGDRAHVLAAYEAHVRASPELLGALPGLRGKALGCCCSTGRQCPTCGRARGACAHFGCHGDVLIRLLDELEGARAAAAGQGAGQCHPIATARPTPGGAPPDEALAEWLCGLTLSDDDPFWADIGLVDLAGRLGELTVRTAGPGAPARTTEAPARAGCPPWLPSDLWDAL
jgi:hypothetical protein